MSAYKKGVRLSVTIAPKASAMIDRLLATGLYGHSRAEVAMWFIYAGLREAKPVDDFVMGEKNGAMAKGGKP